jgi:curved DNA-binding protein CbpA
VFIDHYKILKLEIDCSEVEIKRQYRKLAFKLHPDKNGGSVKSEEEFKQLVNSYEILSDFNSRVKYDTEYLNYKTIKNQSKVPNSNKFDSESKNKQKKSSPIQYYIIWILIAAITYFILISNKTTTGNSKADKELRDQEQNERPQSGEIDFKK